MNLNITLNFNMLNNSNLDDSKELPYQNEQMRVQDETFMQVHDELVFEDKTAGRDRGDLALVSSVRRRRRDAA